MLVMRYLCYSAVCFAICVATACLLHVAVPAMLRDALAFGHQQPRGPSGLELLFLLSAFMVSAASGVFWLFWSFLWAVTDHTHDQRS
jgi:hypothetical protein